MKKDANAYLALNCPNREQLLLQQATQSPLAAGGTISWIEPLQITPSLPPRIPTGLCLRVCAVFQRYDPSAKSLRLCTRADLSLAVFSYAFGRGQVIFDVAFGPDDRIFDIVADPSGYHLVTIPKQPGSYWCLEQLPDPVQLCKMRLECHLAPFTRQVLAFPVPPHMENCQTNVSLTCWPEGVPVLAAGSTLEKVHFLVADQATTPTVTAEFTFNYTRRVLTMKTPQPGAKFVAIHIHDTLSKICLSSDPVVFNFADPMFQQWLTQTGLRRLQQEDEIIFARRVQLYMAQTIAYVPVTAMGKNGGAAALCNQREADSAGHAVLFVSILRANSVPARVLVGRWVSSDIQPAEHCRAEFFADNVGWIPVETTEKGDSLYFGSDAKAPFVTTSFGEMQSQFRVQSTTSYNYGGILPPHVNLVWREPHFIYVAGNLANLNSNVEQWSSVIGDSALSMPNIVGAAHQQPTQQRYSKAHEGGAPSVGARSRPYGPVVTSANLQTAPAAQPAYTKTATYAPPPPVPQRQHAHASVSVTAYGQPVAPAPFMQSQAPPPLPAHKSAMSTPQYGYGQPPMASGPPPALPAHPVSYGASGPLPPSSYQQPPPSLPPSQYGLGGVSAGGPHGYGPPPSLPPHVNNAQGGYGAPPQLPPPSQVPPHGGYAPPPALPPHGMPPPAYGTNPAPNHYLPPPQQLPPSNSNAYMHPPPSDPYAQYAPQSAPTNDSFAASPPQQYQPQYQAPPLTAAAAPSPPLILPTVVQPRPVSIKPQQQLANLEAAQSNGTAAQATSAKASAPPAKIGVPLPGAAKPGAAKPGIAKAWPPNHNGKAPVTAPTAVAAPAAGPKKAATAAPLALNNNPSRSQRTFARAQFEHVPQDHLELALQKGDIIEILAEDDSGWWKASKLGHTGIVPAPYIEKLPPGSKIATGAFPFDAPEPTDLKLAVGEFALLLSLDGDWWEAEAHGGHGNVPNNYIEQI